MPRCPAHGDRVNILDAHEFDPLFMGHALLGDVCFCWAHRDSECHSPEARDVAELFLRRVGNAVHGQFGGRVLPWRLTLDAPR